MGKLESDAVAQLFEISAMVVNVYVCKCGHVFVLSTCANSQFDTHSTTFSIL